MAASGSSSGNERRLLLLGAALVATHLVDAALVDLEPGASIRSHVPWLIGPLALLAAAVIGHRRQPRWLRVPFEGLAGVLALAEGWQHARFAADDFSLTGILLLPAGAALLAAACIGGWGVNRGKSRRRAWLTRVAAAAATAVGAFFVAVPLALAVYLVEKPRAALGHPSLGAPYREVAFRNSDGLTIRGWYVPSRNGAAVVLVHGSGGDRKGPSLQAAMLVRHGYGALLVDAPGRGTSGGDSESFGWTWDRDIRAAVSYLERVGIHRIGAFGLSTGAEAALQSAAEDRRIAAVVADGAEARTARETRLLHGPQKLVLVPFQWITEQAYQALSPASPPPSLKRLVPRIAPRPLLLISTGTNYEREMNRIYYAAAGRPKSLYELPDAQHTRGYETHPAEYERRVVSLFDCALLHEKCG